MTEFDQRGLCILGAGGHGRVVAEIAECNDFQSIEFVDSKFPEQTLSLNWPIVGRDFVAASPGFSCFVAIGNNRLRMAALDVLSKSGSSVPSLIHPAAIVSRYVVIGYGSVVMPGAIINAGARLGRGVIANTGCTIDHDCEIADGVHVSPGANLAGGVSVGRESWIGIGSAVRESIKIGENVLIGAGAAVVRDIVTGDRVVGVPAR
jgi:sugar O-acyltransferase (sialic acid O-acetyltransferase NeuD family)